MTKQVKSRRGTAAEHAAFTGAVGELTAQEQERVKTYRQTLLDITDQDGFPHNIEWPIY